MEFCSGQLAVLIWVRLKLTSGGGIIDLLNKRLRDRLKEIEILNIFTDVCEVRFTRPDSSTADDRPSLLCTSSASRCYTVISKCGSLAKVALEADAADRERTFQPERSTTHRATANTSHLQTM
jgi:hypothetical protein